MRIFILCSRTTISENFLEKNDNEKLKQLIDSIDVCSSEEELNKLYDDLLSMQQYRYMGKWPSVLYKLWRGGRAA